MIRGDKFASAFALAILCILLVCNIDRAVGRRCVCTSKTCKEKGAKICKTRYSCYTELIFTGDDKLATKPATIKTTRGCTESATPLLCETKSWHTSEENNRSSLNSLQLLSQTAWPRLICCDSHDFCNAVDELLEIPIHPVDRVPTTRENASDFQKTQPDGTNVSPGSIVPIGTNNDNQNIQSLHIAALILAIAALISVFAACYVVRRFLNANNVNGGPSRMIGQYDCNQLDF